MAITYTPNLNLAMQENKSDKLNWDAITENWMKIDAAIGQNFIRMPSGISTAELYGDVGVGGITVEQQEES